MKVQEITIVTLVTNHFLKHYIWGNTFHIIHEGHKDQMDYKCDLCDNSFSTAGDMMSHTVSVHENHKD